MSKQLAVGFTAEGSTDKRFLHSIIQRSFEKVAFECKGEIEILPLQFIDKGVGRFDEAILACAKHAYHIGLSVFCVHTDADDISDENAFTTRIQPAFDAIRRRPDAGYCQQLVAIVPVQMTEAWMLADTTLLRKEVGIDDDLLFAGTKKSPEAYSDPKEFINSEIRKAYQSMSRRRRHRLSITDLYAPIGQKIDLAYLEKLPSYNHFLENIREALRQLNYF